MSFIKITEECYYFPGAINIGLIVKEGRGIVIDTGIDKEAARKIAKGLEELSIRPVAIINTHSHADHCGGNVHLKKRYPDLKIIASALEKPLIEQTYYEGFYLFGGAKPPAEMQTKFYKAAPSQIDEVLQEELTAFEGIEFEGIPLSGHSVGQFGIKVGEVFFTADAFFGIDIVDKYGTPYFADIKETLASLDVVESHEGIVVPSHGKVTRDFELAISKNRDTIGFTGDMFLKALEEPHTSNELVQKLVGAFNLNLKALGQYYLANATVMAFLNYFLESEQVTYQIDNGNLLWTLK